jgi:hypothetical protein
MAAIAHITVLPRDLHEVTPTPEFQLALIQRDLRSIDAGAHGVSCVLAAAERTLADARQRVGMLLDLQNRVARDVDTLRATVGRR